MDYITPFLSWLLKCDYIKENKLFLNAVQAKDNSIQLVTQQISKSQDKHYIDGSTLHRVIFTVFDYKSISFNQLVKTMLDSNENVSDLLEVAKIAEYVEQAEKSGDYPNFGDNFEVQAIYCEYLTPSTPAIDNSISPALAKYSIPIICEVLEYA